MKKFLIAFALLLLFIVWYMNGTTTSNPASDSSAAQPRSADTALPQVQQQAAVTAQVDAARAQVTADAQALLAAQQQAQATATVQAQFVQQAVQANEAQATIEARAMLAAQQDAQATATNQAMFAQQAAQANEAKATVDTRAVLLVQQQAQATATAEAMQRESVTAVQAASASRQQSETLAWLIPIGAVIVFGVVVVLATKYISGLIDRANERRSLKNRKLDLITTLRETHDETLAFVGDPAAQPLLNLLSNGEGYDSGEPFASLSSPIAAEVPPAMVIPPDGDPLPPDQEEAREEAARHKLVMKLLRDAIGHTQVHSNHIPSAVQLGWAANAWAIAVAILRPYGVETLPGDEGGTYLIGEYPTLQALYIALGENT
jgi:chemotaxis protein histidine kinase CheA